MTLQTVVDTKAYRDACRDSRHVPLFCTPEWLDAVCGKNGWSAILVKEGNDIRCALPVREKTILWQRVLTQPPLSQNVGPWILGTAVPKESRLLDWLGALASELSKASWVRIGLDPRLDNWLPFHWAGFRQTTRYTYRIDKNASPSDVLAGIASRTRRDIKHAVDRLGLVISHNESVGDAHALIESSFSARGKRSRYSLDILRRLETALTPLGRFDVLMARSPTGDARATIVIVSDDECAYYIASAAHPVHNNRGATSMLLSSSIQRALGDGRHFDFEGSMIKPIEFFVRGFGGKRTPYSVVHRASNKGLSAFLSATGRI